MYACFVLIVFVSHGRRSYVRQICQGRSPGLPFLALSLVLLLGTLSQAAFLPAPRAPDATPWTPGTADPLELDVGQNSTYSIP